MHSNFIPHSIKRWLVVTGIYICICWEEYMKASNDTKFNKTKCLMETTIKAQTLIKQLSLRVRFTPNLIGDEIVADAVPEGVKI